MADPHERLAAQPRVPLGTWPTPLERCDRLRAIIGGPELWLKRDDLTGLAGGGNKTRKLEFLLGRAIAEGASEVITFGALQSNHARQTAAACARLGLPCDLILTRMVPRDDLHYTTSGNLLLDRLFGANVHIVNDTDAAFVRFAEIHEDGRTYVIPPGGSDATGLLGYVDGMLELAQQTRSLGIDVARVSVASSTSGTAAGLILGAAIAEFDVVVDVSCVYHSRDETRTELAALIADGAAALTCDVPATDRWTISDDHLGDGYGIPTDACLDAIDLLARTEGVLLDPVYTGKAFAELLSRIDCGDLDTDRAVVFIHTGGSQALSAYTPAIEEHLR